MEIETLEDVFKSGNFVILDTETTGLGWGSEAVSIGIIDSSGNTLVDTLVKPSKPIPADASRIHGIYDADVANAPAWAEVRPMVIEAVRDKHLIIYNASYDTMILKSTDSASRLNWEGQIDYEYISDWCAMQWYAEIYGDWNDYHESFRWQRLTTAMHQQGLPVVNAHHALGDCLMTLSLLRKLIS